MFDNIDSLISEDKKKLTRGRPKNQKYPKKVIVYLDNEMFDNIQQKADQQDISTSSYIRKILKENLK